MFFITSYKFRKAAAVEAQCALHAVVGKIFREMPGSSGIGAHSLSKGNILPQIASGFVVTKKKFISKHVVK